MVDIIKTKNSFEQQFPPVKQPLVTSDKDIRRKKQQSKTTAGKSYGNAYEEFIDMCESDCTFYMNTDW
jgi:hypothetical protein